MGGNLTAIAKPKDVFFNDGSAILRPEKSNWFEGEQFDGVLSITVEQNCPPL